MTEFHAYAYDASCHRQILWDRLVSRAKIVRLSREFCHRLPEAPKGSQPCQPSFLQVSPAMHDGFTLALQAAE